MVPNRFLPKYQLFILYQELGDKDKIQEIALDIVNSPIKVPSYTVTLIINNAKEWLNKNEEYVYNR